MKYSKKTHKHRFGIVSDMVVTLFVGALLFALVFYAAQMYSRVIAAQEVNDASRSQLSTIAGRLHNADGAGQVTIRKTTYGDALVIAENTDSGLIETRYFKYKNHLYEQTALASAAVAAKNATALSETKVFRVALSGNVVTITTDADTIHVTLRGGTGT